nr:hypothetical protein [Actinomycetota bacterium]
CVLLGIARTDDEAEAERLAGKAARLRIFADEAARRARGELQTLRGRLGSRLGPGRRLRGLLSVRSLGLDG